MVVRQGDTFTLAKGGAGATKWDLILTSVCTPSSALFLSQISSAGGMHVDTWTAKARPCGWGHLVLGRKEKASSKRLSVVLSLGSGKTAQHILFVSRDTTHINYCSQPWGRNNAHHAPEIWAVCKDESAIKQEIAACQCDKWVTKWVKWVTNGHNHAEVIPFLEKKN